MSVHVVGIGFNGPAARRSLAHEDFSRIVVSLCFTSFDSVDDELRLDPSAYSSMRSHPGWQLGEAATPAGQVAEVSLDTFALFEQVVGKVG